MNHHNSKKSYNKVNLKNQVLGNSQYGNKKTIPYKKIKKNENKIKQHQCYKDFFCYSENRTSLSEFKVQMIPSVSVLALFSVILGFSFFLFDFGILNSTFIGLGSIAFLSLSLIVYALFTYDIKMIKNIYLFNKKFRKSVSIKDLGLISQKRKTLVEKKCFDELLKFKILNDFDDLDDKFSIFKFKEFSKKQPTLAEEQLSTKEIKKIKKRKHEDNINEILSGDEFNITNY